MSDVPHQASVNFRVIGNITPAPPRSRPSRLENCQRIGPEGRRDRDIGGVASLARSTLPMRGTLFLASNVYHRPPR